MVCTNKVFIFPNPTRANTQRALPEILDFLLSEGFSVTMEERYEYMLGEEYPIVSFYPMETAAQQSEFVLVVGGDGTILHISALAARVGKPVLGINLGTMGFLSEMDMSDLEMLRKIKAGDYVVDERMMIDAIVYNSNDEEVFFASGLNDVAMMKGDISKIVRLCVSVNERKVMGFAGAGAVVCTPTGSTAYSLSAGGPVLEPNSPCIAVTPVCPHALGIKSFVVSSDKEIEVVSPPQSNTVHLSVDGHQNRNLEPGERTVIRQSAHSLSLIRLKGIGFYERINQKLINERF